METPAAAADSPEGPDAPRRCGCLQGALAPDVRREAAQLLALAAPVASTAPRVHLTAAQRLQPAVSLPSIPCTVDDLSYWHSVDIELDAVMIAVSVVNVSGILVGSGLPSACDTLMSQSFGGKNLKCVGIILQRGVLVLMLCCFPCWAICINTERILLLKQDPDVFRIAQIYVMIFIPALPASFLFPVADKIFTKSAPTFHLLTSSVAWLLALHLASGMSLVLLF